MEKLTELFGKSFIIGYVLPAAIFLLFHISIDGTSRLHDWLRSFESTNKVDVLADTTTLLIVSWFGGFVLMALNRELIRIFEGYGLLNPLRLLTRMRRWHFRKLSEKVISLDSERVDCETNKRSFSHERHLQLGKLKRRLVEQYPDAEGWVLPTKFGNIIRAAEVYPRVMYGVDAIPGWTRLMIVIPKEYRSAIDDAKALLDFWLNLCVVAALVISEAFLWYRTRLSVGFCLGFGFLLLVCYERMCASALRRGEYIKACFDVFLPTLSKKCSFKKPTNRSEESNIWIGFSKAVIYRQRESMPVRDYKVDEEKSDADDSPEK